MLKLLASKNLSVSKKPQKIQNKNRSTEKFDEFEGTMQNLDVAMTENIEEIVKDAANIQKHIVNKIQIQRIRPQPSIRASDDEEQELCGLVGVTFGSKNIFQLFSGASGNQMINYPQFQGFATCLVAFAELQIKSAVEWNISTLNFVLMQGKKLFKQSMDKNGGFLIVKEQVAKCFTINRKRVALHVSEPILIGVVECDNPRVYSLDIGLDMFFQSFEHCLCEVEGKYFLIWKQSGSFFVFDCYGRTHKCESSSSEGLAALICMGAVSTLSAFFRWKSNLNSKSVYTLYFVKLKALKAVTKKRIKLVKPNNNLNYQIIEPGHNILQGKNYTIYQYFKDVRCKHSMPISLMAILYSKAYAPSLWESTDVDKIVKMGHNFGERIMKSGYDHFSLENAFIEVPVGVYRITAEMIPVCTKRIWSKCGIFKAEDDMIEIKKGFTLNAADRFLIQVNQRCFGVFKQGEDFYAIDPYPKKFIGICPDASNSTSTTTVHQFSELNALFNALIYDIIQVPYCGAYSLYIVSILKMNKSVVVPMSRTKEIVSLNNFQAIESRITNNSNMKLRTPTKFHSSNEESPKLIENFRIIPNNENQIVIQNQNNDCLVALGTNTSCRMNQLPSILETKDPFSMEKEFQNISASSSANREIPLFAEVFDESSVSSSTSTEVFKSTGSTVVKSPKSYRSSKSGRSWTLLTISNRSTQYQDSSLFPTCETSPHKYFDPNIVSSKENFQVFKRKRRNEKSEKCPKVSSSKIMKYSPIIPRPLISQIIDCNLEISNRDSAATNCSNNSFNEKEIKKLCNIDNSVLSLNIKQYKKLASPGEVQTEREFDQPDSNGYTNQCMAVVGSATGTYDSLNSLLKAGLQVTDRVLTMTPWGNYAVFKLNNDYYLYDGCTCYPDRFRKHNWKLGDERIAQFQELSDLIRKILKGKTTSLSAEKSEVGSYFSCRGISEA